MVSVQKNPATITVILTIAIVGLILWRNYGVVAVGEEVKPQENKTNEQKELNRAIKKLGQIESGQVIQTSFGVYEFSNGVWKKTKEIWDALKQ